jgi:catechol 2,3-dioxygenase-like lactoylglutathione lyase family enzyme
MTQSISAVTLVVRDYDEAIEWYRRKLGFTLVEDSGIGGNKRWVVMAPPGSHGARLVFGKAATQSQENRIGDQAGGRVLLFLSTDDIARDHAAMLANGVRFRETPRREPYGSVAVFEDLYGNAWDLLEPKSQL